MNSVCGSAPRHDWVLPRTGSAASSLMDSTGPTPHTRTALQHWRADARGRHTVAAKDVRADGPGTWITPAMLSAYTQLHERGIARSIEVRDEAGELVGGLYGIALGRVFFGESMFSLETDASKVALVALVTIMRRGGYELIDCQVESEHLNSLGARNISRVDFEQRLAHTPALRLAQHK